MRWIGQLQSVLGCMLFVACLGQPLAALRTGTLIGRVIDEQGVELPGATLVLIGDGSPQESTSSVRGRFWFAGLDPGNYVLKAKLEGFSTIDWQIRVKIGRNRIDIALNAAIEDVITVTDDSMTDDRSTQILFDVASSELDRLPRQAEPWSVIAQTPGILVEPASGDGRLPTFTAPGSASQENFVSLDGGIALNLKTFAGATPDFSDVGSLQEVQVMAGGAEISTPTAGVQVNLITRRGTDKWRGSGRYHLTPAARPSDSNDVDKIEDYGIEGGGRLPAPVQLWGWAAFGRRQLDLLAVGGQPDATAIGSETYKLNSQLGADSAVVSVKEGDNRETGRGVSPRRGQEASWDQRASQRLWTLEETHLFGPEAYLTGSFSGASENLELVALGGDNEARRDNSGTWQGSSFSFDSKRRVDQLRLEASRFLLLGSVDHEFKLGASLVREKVSDTAAWPEVGVLSLQGENFGLGTDDIAVVTRQGKPVTEVRTGGLWIQDTLTVGSLTASLGLRLDKQVGRNEAGSVAASPVRPDLLPALRFGGADADDPSWLDFSPRAAVSWSTNRTELRASYSRFAERLNVERVSRTHPLALTSAFHFFTDLNGNQSLEPGELGALFHCDNCSEEDPDRPQAANRNARSLEATLTDELMVGIGHSFWSEFEIALSLVYRHLSRIPEERVLVVEGGQIRVATRADYQLDGFVSGPLPDGAFYRKPYFSLHPGLTPTGGKLLVNGDRTQDYLGASFTLAKRLADHWSLRCQANWSQWTWNVPETFEAFADPTDFEDPGDNDGAPVAERLPTPLGEDSEWLGGRWSFDLSGLFQVAPDRRWGFDVSGRFAAQEGSPQPLFHRVIGSDGIIRDVAVATFDNFKGEDIGTVDLRLAKELSLGSWMATLSLDAFNLISRTPALVRERNQSLSNVGTTIQTALPRTFRLGIALRY